MDGLVINPKALEEIRHIHQKSQRYNQRVAKDHTKRLLELIQKHVKEIEGLLEKKNPHGLIETGDLIVLCFELLLENEVSIDKILRQCFKRYENKLSQLMTEAEAAGY